MFNNKNVKMSDIAKALNVSTVTVSKALSNKDGVSKELKMIIKKKAEEMGYVYNPIPKQLLDGKTNNIAIVVSKKFLVRGYDVYFQMYEVINQKLADYGYYGILEVLTKQAEFECEAPRMINEGKVDGIILLGQISSDYLTMIAKFNVPFVLLDFYGGHDDVDAIVTDNFFGSYIATTYLIENGHKKIGFVGNYKVTSSIMDRYMGYLKAIIENELFTSLDEMTVMDRDQQGVYIPLILPKNMPTAFVCNNDEIAISLIAKLESEGFKVPNDVSVIGFDNFDNTEKKVNITTVEVDFISLAATSVDTIIKKVNNQEYTHGRQLINCRLVVRDSVKSLK